MLVDGESYRMEVDPDLDPAYPFDVLIARDASGQETGLYIEPRTYYQLKESLPGFVSSLFTLLPGGDESVKNVKLETFDKPEPEEISGMTARRREIHLSYDITVRIYKEKVPGKVRMEATYWMVEDKDLRLPRMLRPDIHTSIPEIDAKLDEALSKLRGFAVRQAVKVTAESNQGPRRMQLYNVNIYDLKKTDAPSSLFEVPKGFRYEEPVFEGPGAPPINPGR
ncbi:MAG TPA: hypothetical protein VMW27_29995 [Thermoanaerobaculia bacterium]|nr:hypothetical protein [Thermoanaerobaculia bacterium]